MSNEKITVSKNGPYKVEGEIALFHDEGNPVETRAGRPYFLCRCGQSGNKPFCDGTHNRVAFSGTLAEKG